MTTRKTRTVIAVVLSLIMALAYMPCTAFAADGDQTQDIDALKQAMEEAEGIMNTAKTEMDEAETAMEQAKTDWENKKTAAETANSTATASETAATTAEQERDDAFAQVKADARTAYNNAVTDYNNAKDAYESALADYQTKVGNLNTLTSQKTTLEGEVSQLQDNLTAAKQEKATLEAELPALNNAVTEATNKWHEDQQAAQETLEQAQAAVDEAGYTFINSKINALGSEFFTIDEMIETCKTYTDTALSESVTFNGKQISTIADVANDALFLSIVKSNCTKENLLFAMDMIDESNTLREAEGKDPMGVSYQLMGAAIMSNSYTLYSWGHDLFRKNGKTPENYANTDSFWAIGPASQGNENIAASTGKYSSAYEPYTGWYDEEKTALQKAVNSGKWPGLTMDMSTRTIWNNYPNLSYESDKAGFGQVGHYLTLKNEEYTTTGAAVTYNTGTVPTVWRGRATQSFNDDTVNSITTTQCRNEINTAFASVETALQSAQSDVNELNSKPQSVTDAEAAVTAKQGEIDTATQNIANINGQIQTKTGQIETLDNQIQTKQSEVNTATTTKDEKETAMGTAHGIMEEKETANTKAQAIDVNTPSTYEDFPNLVKAVNEATTARTKATTDRTAANTAADEVTTAEGLYNTAKSDYSTKKTAYDTAATNYNTAKASYDKAVGNEEPQPPVKTSIAGASVVLSNTTFTYNGNVQKPTIKTIGNMTLAEGTDYTAVWSNASSKNAGTYTVTVTGTGNYEGSAKATYTIGKAANPMTVKGKTVTVKYSKLKKKTQKVKSTKVLKIAKNAGKVTYVKASGNKKITINKKTGKVTVKKGLKKGKYKVKVKVTAAGNANYNSITKKVTFTVRVK